MSDIKITPPNATKVGEEKNEKQQNLLYINGNKLLSKEQRKTKPTGVDVQNFNKRKNITEHIFTDITEFEFFLDAGNTIYSGCFEKNANKLTISDVSQTQIVFVDIDGGDLYEFLDKNYDFIESYGFLVQPSISSDLIIPNKFHLFLILDSPVYTDEDYKLIWEWVYTNLDFSQCNVDKSKQGINNLIFFSDKKTKNLYKNSLDTKGIIEIQKQIQEEIEKNNNIESVGNLTENLDEIVNTGKKKKKGITEKVLSYFHKTIFVEKCNSDIDKLYCLHDHKFRKRRVSGQESSLGITRKWDGSNPFSSTNSTGTSLCVSQFGNKLPVFFDRSQNYGEVSHLEQGKYRHGGTFISYWWECGKLGVLTELGIKRKPYTGELWDKGKFLSVLKDIAKYFGVEPFSIRKHASIVAVTEEKPNIVVTEEKPNIILELSDKSAKKAIVEVVKEVEGEEKGGQIVKKEIQTTLAVVDENGLEKVGGDLGLPKEKVDEVINLNLQEIEKENSEKESGGEDVEDKYVFVVIMEKIEEYIVGKIYSCQWEDGLYLYFSPSSKTWQYTKSVHHIITHVIQPLIKKIYNDRVLTRDEKLIELITKRIENECTVEYGKLDFPPDDDVDKTPFLNGVYDIKTKKLYDYYDPHINGYIHYHVVPWNFKEVDDDNPTIAKLKNHFDIWMHNESKAKTLFSWVVLNVQRQAYKTGKMVGLSGQSGAGKSTYCEYLLALFGRLNTNFAIKVDPNELTGSGKTHATSVLEGRNLIVLDELKGDTYNTSVDKIKSFTGQDSEHGILVTINPKNMKHRTIRLKAAFTWNRQGGILLKDDDQGFNRRTVIINLEKKCISEGVRESWKYLLKDSNLETVFNWAIIQNTEMYFKMFMDTCMHPDIKDDQLQTRKDNNPVYQWTESCFVITGDTNDFVPSADLYSSYELWATVNKFDVIGKIKFSKKLKEILQDSDYVPTEEFDKIEFCQKRHKGSNKAKRGISGIKLIDSEDVLIESIEEENKLNDKGQFNGKPSPGSFEQMVNN